MISAAGRLALFKSFLAKTAAGGSYALDDDLEPEVLADRVYTVGSTLTLYLDDMQARLGAGEVESTDDLLAATATAQAIIAACQGKVVSTDPPELDDSDVGTLRADLAQLRTDAEALDL